MAKRAEDTGKVVPLFKSDDIDPERTPDEQDREDANGSFCDMGPEVWDNQYTFYVQAYDLEEAENKAWIVFDWNKLGGVLGRDEWFVWKAEVGAFDSSTFFVNRPFLGIEIYL